jgi:signal transduction histidine kinase
MSRSFQSLASMHERISDLLATRGVLGMLYFYIDVGPVGRLADDAGPVPPRDRSRLAAVLVDCIEDTFSECHAVYFRDEDFVVRGPRRTEWFVFLASPPRSRFGLTRRDLGEVERRVARELRVRLREALPRTGRGELPPLRCGSAVLEQNPTLGIAASIEEARHIARLHGEVERLLDDQLSGLNHKIRTPLTTIKGVIEILRHDPEAAPRFLGSLEQEVERMQRQLNQASLLTRVRSGLFDWARQEINLTELVSSVLSSAQAVADEHGAAWRFEPGQETIVIHGSLEILEEAVRQVLDNAFRYAARGGPILIAVRAVGKHAIIEVLDRGPGIAPEDQANLFKPFYIVGQDADTQAQGGGLGLALVQGIAEIHGGAVECESVVGKGTCIRVRLPLQTA